MMIVKSWTSCLILAIAFMLFSPPASVKAASDAGSRSGPKWAQRAEKEFYLSPGLGRELLTHKEWRKQWNELKKMRPVERAAARVEWHRKLMQEARDKGIPLPEVSPDHGAQKRTQTSMLPKQPLSVAGIGDLFGAGDYGCMGEEESDTETGGSNDMTEAGMGGYNLGHGNGGASASIPSRAKPGEAGFMIKY
jgi:hypothetical protein